MSLQNAITSPILIDTLLSSLKLDNEFHGLKITEIYYVNAYDDAIYDIKSNNHCMNQDDYF